MLSILGHTFQSATGFTPIMLPEDFARETGFGDDQMRSAIKDAEARGLIARNPEIRCQYKLCPETWGRIENAFAMREPSITGRRARLPPTHAEVLICSVTPTAGNIGR